MTDFRKISEDFIASPQISAADVAEAKAAGVTMIINNRPDGEADDQPPGDDIARAAGAAGIAYRAIPVGAGGFGAPQLEAMNEALDAAEGKVLGFCRTGTRSTLLWALAQASRGETPAAIAKAAARGGYDIAPVREAVDLLAARAQD